MERKNPLRGSEKESKSSAIDQILSGLNDSQRAAVETDARACLVLAGPGSGKTHTITARIRYLIHCRGVPPEKILVITFTKDAAVSMKRRFAKSESLTLPVVFGTFHSVFYQILRESKGYSSKKLLSDSYKAKVFSKIISEIIPENDPSNECRPGDCVPEFISAVSFYKNTCDKKGSAEMLSKEAAPYFEQVFEKYEEYRISNKMIDFDDMVYDCYRLLTCDEKAKSKWINRFDHILIDEYQDINQRQFETVSLLFGDNCNMFAVGDDDQSIYGFRGAKPGCLKLFSDIFNAKIYKLDINYRSGQNIIDCASAVISENRDRFKKSQRSSDNGYEKGQVFLRAFDDKEKQYSEIGKELIKNDNIKGVLFRTNLGMQRFASFLTERGFSYYIKDSNPNVYDHPAALDLLAYLKAADQGDNDALYRIINKPTRYISREALSCGSLEGASLYYRNSKDIYKAGERIREIETLKKDLEFLKGKSVFLQIRYIRNKIGLDKYYRKQFKNIKFRDEYIAVLDHITDDAKRFESPEDFYDHINNYREDYQKNKKSTDKNMNIQLMTIHASKGLEFDEVYIPDVNEGTYPHGKMLDKESMEEERRVFYVALTRAKNKLYISYLKKEEDSGFYLPSRFLNPLKER